MRVVVNGGTGHDVAVFPTIGGLSSCSRGAWPRRSPRGYVENVAAALAPAATSERARGRVYNVGEAESFSELEWARTLASATGWDGEFVVVEDEEAPASLRMPGNLAQHWVVDTTRLRWEPGYRELIAREEATRRTVAWKREHPPAVIDAARFDYEAEDGAARGCPR
ncbi:MAG: hypothetical protein ABR499_05875 [Gemmatimonadaceae bacterium]